MRAEQPSPFTFALLLLAWVLTALASLPPPAGLKRQLEITPSERVALERYGDQARPHMDVEDGWYDLEAIEQYAKM